MGALRAGLSAERLLLAHRGVQTCTEQVDRTTSCTFVLKMTLLLAMLVVCSSVGVRGVSGGTHAQTITGSVNMSLEDDLRTGIMPILQALSAQYNDSA